MAGPLQLKFRLDEVPPEGRAFEGELPLDVIAEPLAGLVGELGYRIAAAPRVTGTAYRSAGGEVVVDARVELLVGYDCVRCLVPSTLALSLRQDHVFTKKSVRDEEQRGFDDEALNEPDEHPIEGEEIDLVPVLREDVLLEMPMNPSCETPGSTATEPCADLGATDAGSEPVDPRWAPLLELKKKLN